MQERTRLTNCFVKCRHRRRGEMARVVSHIGAKAAYNARPIGASHRADTIGSRAFECDDATRKRVTTLRATLFSVDGDVSRAIHERRGSSRRILTREAGDRMARELGEL